jgi:hypothetical protein
MTSTQIDLRGIDRAEALAALYNSSKQQGNGEWVHDPSPMTRGQAQELLDSGQEKFQYLHGRVMKVDLSGDTLNPWLYDRDNGSGAAEKAISSIR